MNSDDKTLALIEEFLGDEHEEFHLADADLLDSDWDGEDMFAA